MPDNTINCPVCEKPGFAIAKLPLVYPQCGRTVELLIGKPSAEYQAKLDAARATWAQRGAVSDKPPELARDPFEFLEEWKERLEARAWPAGRARLDPKNYNVDEGLYTIEPEWDDWLKAAEQALSGALTLEAERDRARELYRSQPQDGYAVAVRLACDADAERVSVRECLLVVGNGGLQGLEPADCGGGGTVVQTGCDATTVLGGGGGSDVPIGEDFTVDLGGGVKLELVWVAPGNFRMGSYSGADNEKPIHEVRISRGYWLGSRPVTQAQWRAVMGDDPSHFKSAYLPVESVFWKRCAEFCAKLTETERRAGRLPDGCEYRLPTEAEWEYAARGGEKSRGYEYAGSNKTREVAWYDGNSGGKTHPVGQKQSNELGLYDMSGNVWEWCLDCCADYPRGSLTDPCGPKAGSRRVSRGGGWGDHAVGCRVAVRSYDSPLRTADYIGFRVSLGPSL